MLPVDPCMDHEPRQRRHGLLSSASIAIVAPRRTSAERRRVCMAFEIERKFLVTSADWMALATGFSRIRQAYLTSNDKASIRVRIKDNHTATLTIKSRGAELRRLELEYDIPVIEAEAMLPLRRGSVIEKRRALVPYEGHVWEIDTFLSENAGLVVAEIELASEHQVFSRPPWLGVEVTRQASYYNSALAALPFTKWTHEDRGAAASNRPD
jgi:adenylate cyclase